MLVNITTLLVEFTCSQFNWMCMIWKGIPLSINGLTQSKNQAMMSGLNQDIWDRIESRHLLKTEKKLLYLKFTEACSRHNNPLWKKFATTRVKPRAGGLELASWPNRAIDREGPWLESWPKKLMVTLDGLHDHIWRWEKFNEGCKHHCNTPPIWALWQSGQTQASPHWRD